MSSSALAIETGTLRPGLLAGQYPERDEQRLNWLERCLSQLQGGVARISVDRNNGLQQIAAQIDRYGEALTDLEQPQLEPLLLELRRQLRSNGLSRELCMQAFALIREMSARTIQLRHYAPQLMGGWSMLHGKLAEMETGEGNGACCMAS